MVDGAAISGVFAAVGSFDYQIADREEEKVGE